jgi:predicted phage tail protein
MKGQPLKFRTALHAALAALFLFLLPILASHAAHAAQVTLVWDASTDTAVVGYKIYYGTTEKSYPNTMDVGNTTTWTVNSLADGTTYYFAAKAYDSQGNESDFSNEVSHATPAVCLAPSAPSAISYPSSSTTGSFEVGWTSVSGATTYVLERSTSSNFSTVTQVYSNAANFFAQTGLPSGTYYYRVKAVSTCGESGWAAGTAVTVNVCTAPSTPGSLSYPTSSDTGSFSISWATVSGATSYVLERSTSSSFSTVATAYSGSATSFSQTGLPSGTYYYRVKAVASCGESGWRTGPALTVNICTAPSAPGSISYPSTSNSGAFTVSWPSVSGATTYVVERSASSNFSSSAQVFSGSSTSYGVTGLDTGTYYFRVKAVGSCGESGWTAGPAVTVSVTMSVCSAPAVPGSLTYPSSSDSGAFTVSWGSATGATSYVLERSTSSSFSMAALSHTTAGTSYSESGLASGSYYYRVKSVGTCGESLWNTGGAVTVSLCTAPAAPSSLSDSYNRKTGVFTLSWGASTGATSYVLESSTSSSFSTSTVIYTGSNTSFSQKGAPPRNTYFRVKSISPCGESGWTTKTVTRKMKSASDLTIDITAIDYSSTDGTPIHQAFYHGFAEVTYSETFNNGYNRWQDAPGTTSSLLVSGAWRMLVPDSGQTTANRSSISGSGEFDNPPTNFSFGARLGSFGQPDNMSPYTVYVGTSSDSDGLPQCKAFATVTYDPYDPAGPTTIEVNGWLGTNDGSQKRAMLARPIFLEGFEASTEELGLKVEVTEDGKRCTASYQRNDQQWVTVGSLEAAGESRIYGWFGGPSDVQPSVEVITEEADPKRSASSSPDASGGSGGGGGGCALNPTAGFGAEWLLLLLLLGLCRVWAMGNRR